MRFASQTSADGVTHQFFTLDEIPGGGFDRADLLYYTGHDAQQTKLSGHRPEFDSAEAALLRHRGVVDAVVAREGARRTACLELRGESPCADDLAVRPPAPLPSYVRVDRCRRPEALPRTFSGKLDRQVAPRAPGGELRRSTLVRTELSAQEEQLSVTFEEIIGAAIGPDQIFFDAGAPTIALMRFHLRCTTVLGPRFGVVNPFEHVTVRALALRLAAEEAPTHGRRAVPAAKDGGRPEPDEPIAVVGMAVRVPGAPDLAAFLDLVVSGDTGISRIDAPEGMVGTHSTHSTLVAEDWSAGKPVDRRTGPVPAAPWDFPPPSFALTRHDFDCRSQHQAAEPRGLPRAGWPHQPHCLRLRHAAVTATTARAARASLAVVAACESMPRTAFAAFSAVASRVVRVHPTGAFARREADVLEADLADPASPGLLLDVLTGDGTPVLADTQRVHAPPLDVREPVCPAMPEHARHARLDTTAALAQVLSGRDASPRVWWLSYGARPVAGTADRPELTLLARPVEVTPQGAALNGHWLEPPRRRSQPVGRTCGLVHRRGVPDRGVRRPSSAPATRAAAALLAAAGTTPVPAPSCARPLVPPDEDTVHLVLDGTGGIGTVISAWLLEHTGSRLLPLSRNPRLPAEPTRRADRVALVQADLGARSVHDVTAAVAEHSPRLDNVIQAAGLEFGGLLVRRDAAAMRDTATAWEKGPFVVEHLVETLRLDIAVDCSSMSALLCGVGQSDYAAGAGLCDSFAHHQATETETTLRIAVDWDIWRETGSATRVSHPDSRQEAHPEVGLTVKEGMAVFADALTPPLPHLLVSTTGIGASRAFYATSAGDRTRPLNPPSPPVHGTDGEADSPAPDSAVERAGPVAPVIQDQLGPAELNPHGCLDDLGADSLPLIDLIEDDCGVAFNLSSFNHRIRLTGILKLVDAALAPAEPTARAEGNPLCRVVLDTRQEGTGPAVLCPVGGDIQTYRSLVAALGPSPTVCLIADPVLRDPVLRDPEMPEWSLAEHGRSYDACLCERFGGREQRLHQAGWSFGARVAMEMAGLADSAGRPLGSLHLLDPPPRSDALLAAYGETRLEDVFAAELGAGASPLPPGYAQAPAEKMARCCRANLRSLDERQMRPLALVRTLLWLAEDPAPEMPALGAPQET